MEATLMYLTGNDPRLAEDLISAFSALTVNDGTGTVQPGEHAETVRPSRKSVIAWLAGRTHPRDRRGSRHIRIRTFQTPRLCPARDKRIPGRSRCSARVGDIAPCPVIS